MRSCGVVVEYNPFHNGHYYHIQEAKKVSKADVMIAVMSGNFLQRGEPAMMDKFHRAKAALSNEVDLVIELPYAFAVQNSDFFAKGAVRLLQNIGASSICFGSESGNPDHFVDSYQHYISHRTTYENELKEKLNQGLSFPEASMNAYGKIGLTNESFDLSQPNNILGLGYVKAVIDDDLPMEIHTIKRLKNHFHDPEIHHPIASATSIRKEMLEQETLTKKARSAMPDSTIAMLESYKESANLWHDWEKYFQFVHYRVQTMAFTELEKIHGMTEGLEYRLKNTAKHAENMNDWIQKVKTKRYTWTRLQRLFTHILTNTTKEELEPFLQDDYIIPYIRVLGMNKRGQEYLNHVKKELDTPILTKFGREMTPLLKLEERASLAYYSILPPTKRKRLIRQELAGPVRL